MKRFIIEMLYETPEGLSAREFAIAAPDHNAAISAAVARAQGLPEFDKLIGGSATLINSEPELTAAKGAHHANR